jgi:preprotein translocase subunit SecE
MEKITGFFSEVRNELQKVVWPTWNETVKYTATVILFSVVIALILGAADYGLLKLFQTIINK